jgi:ubiquinone/menaquinone biosynthesis C-methylase UbiE
MPAGVGPFAPTSRVKGPRWLLVDWTGMTPNSFDSKAATWDDDPAKVERASAVARTIVEAVPLDPRTRLLEYGAGTGLVTQALRDLVGPVTLADTSKGMRDVLAGKIEAGTLTGARVWDVDLAVQPVPDERFDVIVTVMTLHHIEDVGTVLTAFARLLAEGGRLCVVDLDAEDGSFHGESFGGHRGFERSLLAADLADAGFTDVEFRDCHRIERPDGDFPLFLATARRAPDR